MREAIYPLTLRDLEPATLFGTIYPNPRLTYFWSVDWSPEFYVKQARAGMIAVAYHHDGAGDLLIPEMQDAYAVLDFANLRIPKAARKAMRSEAWTQGEIGLRVTADPMPVMAGICTTFGDGCWLLESYRELMCALAANPPMEPPFRLEVVELRHLPTNTPVAGELGYTIGATYTSLTGFFVREPRWSGMGLLQLVLLGEALAANGYAFWNLGHPEMQYKHDLGAQVLARGAFLERWLPARDAPMRQLSIP